MTDALTTFSPTHLPALVEFLNRVLAGHRHWAPITEADFAERVLVQPGFDPKGLILAWAGDAVVGGVHAIKPRRAWPRPRHRSLDITSPGWQWTPPSGRRI